jgi:hypothetical protein
MKSADCKEIKWYQSRMLWVNGIALLATLVQARYGYVIDPALQGILLTIANILLRSITNTGIEGMEGMSEGKR